MKTIKIILLSLFAIIVLCVITLFILIKTFDINKYLPQITATASQAIGRKLNIEKANLALSFQGAVLDISGIAIDDPKSKLRVDVRSTSVDLDLMKLIIKRQVQVKDIALNDTTVKIDQIAFNVPKIKLKVSNFAIGSPFDVLITTDPFNFPMVASLITAQLFAHFDLVNVHVNDFTINVAEGMVKAEGDIKDIAKTQEFIFNVTLAEINLERLIDVNVLPVILKGKINGHAHISGQGFDPKVMLKSLKGQGDVNIKEGTIERFNILKTVLGSALGGLGFLADALDGLLTGIAGGESTVLEQARAKFTMEDEILFLDEVVASTHALELNAKGTIGFDLNTQIQVSTLLTADASAQLAGKVAELSVLQDENKRIKIDGVVEGTMPKLKFKASADVKKAAKNALIEQGTKQLDKVLEKNPEIKELLNGVLDQIFK